MKCPNCKLEGKVDRINLEFRLREPPHYEFVFLCRQCGPQTIFGNDRHIADELVKEVLKQHT